MPDIMVNGFPLPDTCTYGSLRYAGYRCSGGNVWSAVTVDAPTSYRTGSQDTGCGGQCQGTNVNDVIAHAIKQGWTVDDVTKLIAFLHQLGTT